MTAAFIALSGCATNADTDDAPTVSKAESRVGPGKKTGDARAAALITKALDVTYGQEYLRSTRRKKTEGTTVLRIALDGATPACEAHARKGKTTMDFVVTTSALYTRGSKGAYELAPEDVDPVRARVMADRWIERSPAAYASMRNMCTVKTRRGWLKEHMPALSELEAATPTKRRGVMGGRRTTVLTYEREQGPLKFHIAAEGTPYLLRVTYPAKDLDESFGDFGKPFRVATPQGAVSEDEMVEEVLAAG